MPRTEDFGRQEGDRPSLPASAARLGPTIIASGEIAAEEDLVVQGAFKGTIRLTSASIYIDRGAVLEADVSAAQVIVFGTVTGNIRASGRVFLASESKVRGDVEASRLSVEEGAQFRGAVRMEKSGG